jgi:hypothetical protein
MRNMMLTVSVLTCATAFASEVKITLLEEHGNQKNYYSLDTDAMSVRIADSATGRALSAIEKYSIKNHHLVVNGQQLADADEILSQTRLDGFEIVIVRREQTSLASIGRIFSAANGNPTRVNVILVLKLQGNAIMAQREITKRGGSQHLTAKMSK